MKRFSLLLWTMHGDDRGGRVINIYLTRSNGVFVVLAAATHPDAVLTTSS